MPEQTKKKPLTAKMIGTELAADLSSIYGSQSTPKKAGMAVETIFQYIADSLREGNAIAINGFGKFEVQDKPARKARNPATGEMIDVAAKKVLKFRPAKALKDHVI